MEGGREGGGGSKGMVGKLGNKGREGDSKGREGGSVDARQAETVSGGNYSN